ncbi:MAG: hypothetical protein AAGJ34_05675 [Pseudomonadota bacterium]
MRVSFGVLLIAVFLTGCIYGTENIQDSAEVVRAASYREPGPATITLFTSIDEVTNRGEHTALLINGPERVLYDPAGRFRHINAPEQADVLFGITDDVLGAYYAHQAPPDHFLRAQTIVVSQEIARIAYEAARMQGRSGDGFCTVHTSAILSKIPGFDVGSAIFPKALSGRFAELDGVITRDIRIGDPVSP